MAEEKKTTTKAAPKAAAAKKPAASASSKTSKAAPAKASAASTKAAKAAPAADVKVAKAAPAVEVAAAPSAAEKSVKVLDKADRTGQRSYRKTRQGVVVSNKMDKTIVVQVEERSKHGLYGKVVKKYKKFKAHDQENTAGEGDTVIITETRPLSATKRWRLSQIVERSK
ncbi:hypothetical protein FACS1894125_7030 [Actinomycetota bacterium]|nr:hypothetical protein FACS1894125_7030 [Actinomycetota bacterium]